jgi:hypothetical protein
MKNVKLAFSERTKDLDLESGVVEANRIDNYVRDKPDIGALVFIWQLQP